MWFFFCFQSLDSGTASVAAGATSLRDEATPTPSGPTHHPHSPLVAGGGANVGKDHVFMYDSGRVTPTRRDDQKQSAFR